MKIKIVATGLKPPLTESVYEHDGQYDVSDEIAKDFLQRSWAIAVGGEQEAPPPPPPIEKATAEPHAETATGRRQRGK